MASRKEELIARLNLRPHPEGGFFSETYRCETAIGGSHDIFPGSRNFSTAIFYLLGSQDISRLHRIKSDEVWHHYEGSSLTIHTIQKNGNYQTLHLGKDITAGQSPQHVVRAGTWFGVTVDEKNSYTLAGCTVSPGFDFRDFEMGDPKKMVSDFPQHERLIKKLLP